MGVVGVVGEDAVVDAVDEDICVHPNEREAGLNLTLAQYTFTCLRDERSEGLWLGLTSEAKRVANEEGFQGATRRRASERLVAKAEEFMQRFHVAMSPRPPCRPRLLSQFGILPIHQRITTQFQPRFLRPLDPPCFSPRAGGGEE